MDLVKLKENKLLLFAFISTILAVLAFANTNIVILLFMLAILFVLNLSINNGLVYLGYISCFCRAFNSNHLFYSLLCSIVAILTFKAICCYHKERWDNKSKVFKTLFICAYLYLVVQPAIYFFFNISKHAFTHLMMLYMLIHVLVFIYFAFGQISVKEFIKYLIAGTIISCLISLIGHLTNLINYERLIVDEGNGIYRFAGIFPHCNTLVRSCVLGLAGLIVFAFENPKKISNYILMLVLTFIGMSTFSKAFFILMALLILFVVIYSFVKARNKKKWCKWFGILCIIGVLAVILAFPYFKTIFERFILYCNDTGFFNMITTGRVGIWKEFLKELNNPLYLILGKSFMLDIPNQLGIHSTYLAILYQYGILGSLIFTAFTILLLTSIKKYKKSSLYYIFLLAIILTGITSDYVFTHFGALYLLFALMFVVSEEKTHGEENEVLKKETYLFLKRVFDVCVAIVGLIISCIPMIIIAVLIKLTSKGPVLFKDKRIGKDGKQIFVYKFRSMYVDAESRLEQYLTKEQLELWKTERKIENDPRITKIGKFIRKTSLDELPQLINILKGDLSVVGNRPISKLEYDTWFSDEDKRKINTMRPGLTGYWQVYGRSNVSWQSGKRQEMCLYYVNNPSIWLDIKIFFKTFIVVIFRRGAK